MRSLDLFSGIGGITYALRGMGIDPVAYCEISPSATAFLKDLMRRKLLPRAPIQPDVRTLSPKTVGKVDIIAGGFPCFFEGTLVVTRDGYKPIEDVEPADLLLAHTGELRPIAAMQRRLYSGDAYTITARYHPGRPVACTPEHPFYARAGPSAPPEWVEARRLTGEHYVGLPVDARAVVPRFDTSRKLNQHGERRGQLVLDRPEQWWAMGYFMGDGWVLDTRKRDGRLAYRIVFAVSHRDEPEVLPRLREVFRIGRKGRGDGCDSWAATSEEWWRVLRQFGKYAHGKRVPDWVQAAPCGLLRQFVDGYMAADGCKRTVAGAAEEWRMATASSSVALGMQRLLLKLGHLFSVQRRTRPPVGTIAGRRVNQHTEFYEVSGRPGRQRRCGGFVEDGYAWYRVESVAVSLAVERWVYNFEVERDNSYAVENLMTHNCVGYSTAGKREGIEQHESALFKEMMRLTKVLKPPFVFMENVAAIVNSPTGLPLVIKTLHGLGYDCQWMTITGKDVGAPQKRDRWFCLAIARGVKDGIKLSVRRIEPFDWKTEPSARLLPGAVTAGDRAVHSAMGNGVIPDCVRAAFLLLWQGLPAAATTARSLFAQTSATLKRAQPKSKRAVSGSLPTCGVAVNGVAYECTCPKFERASAFKGIVLMPYSYKNRHKVVNEISTERVRSPLRKPSWATPRRVLSASHVLTVRSANDLATQLRFERSTPEAHRVHSRVSPEWVLWLMGYPSGYLKRTSTDGRTMRSVAT